MALGSGAGRLKTIGDDNLYIANDGVFGNESGQLEIGPARAHTQATITGVLSFTS